MKNRRALRGQIIARLKAGDFSALVELAGKDAGVAPLLMQFFYDPHDGLHWRAVEGLGYVAAAHPEQVKKLINRLLYLLNEDSGSTGWGAASALGEIARQQISLVAEIIPVLVGFLEDKFSQGPMLWGLGRLGEVRPDLLAEAAPKIVLFLTNTEPQLRAYAAWCLGKMRYPGAIPGLQALSMDASQVEIYDRGELLSTTVGRVAQEALEGIGSGHN
jgi:hypothetical protein